MLIHSRDRPHDCEICGISFTEKGSFTKHMRIHSANKTHYCETWKIVYIEMQPK